MHKKICFSSQARWHHSYALYHVYQAHAAATSGRVKLTFKGAVYGKIFNL